MNKTSYEKIYVACLISKRRVGRTQIVKLRIMIKSHEKAKGFGTEGASLVIIRKGPYPESSYN